MIKSSSFQDLSNCRGGNLVNSNGPPLLHKSRQRYDVAQVEDGVMGSCDFQGHALYSMREVLHFTAASTVALATTRPASSGVSSPSSISRKQLRQGSLDTKRAQSGVERVATRRRTGARSLRSRRRSFQFSSPTERRVGEPPCGEGALHGGVAGRRAVDPVIPIRPVRARALLGISRRYTAL